MLNQRSGSWDNSVAANTPEGRDAVGIASTYHPAGNQNSRVDGKGEVTYYQFDSLNRMTRTDYPDASRVYFYYDSLGNRTRMDDPGGITAWAYDALSRTMRETLPAGWTTYYEYDEVGNVRSMVDPDGGKYYYTYDAGSKRMRKEDSYGTTRRR